MKHLSIIAAASLVVLAGACNNVSEEQALADYNAKMENFFKDYNTTAKAIYQNEAFSAEEKSEKMDSLYEALVPGMIEDGKAQIKKYPSGKLAVAAIRNIYTSLETDQEKAEILAMLKDSAAVDPYVTGLKNHLEAVKKTAEGQMFTDFEVETRPGVFEKLSDYVGKGKYVLVDFWASWCGPCKREMPNLKNVYETYKGEDFDMLSVAVWERGKFQSSIDTAAAYGMTWNHMINAESIPTELYGIDGIPHIILFGPDGTILKRDLRGEKIGEEIAKYVTAK